jgi:lipopolysaccharide transport system ATP-binding protein
MGSDIAISVRDVAKKFRLFASPKERLMEALHPFRKQYHREFWALRGVSFDVRRGEIVGILGRNGSGKSTLLQIICSVMRPTRGDVTVNGRISALLELGAGFNLEFTGRENVILNGAIMGLSRNEMERRLPEIEAFADIGEFFDQPVKTYSSGMFVRVAFAAAIHVDPEILIVDEALSVGDSRFQHRCYQKIREFMTLGKTILVVSHATDTLLRICDRGVVIDAGELLHIGPISDAVSCYHDLLFGGRSNGDGANIAWLDSPSKPGPSTDLHTLGVLSADCTDRICEKASYNSYETRLGNGDVRIVDFDLIVDGLVNPTEIPPHSDVQLIAKICFSNSFEDVTLGFGILSVDGVYIFGMHAEGLSGERGTCRAVSIRWKSHLVGGEYFVSLGCHTTVNGEKQFLDVRRSMAKVQIGPTQSSIGFADLEATWAPLDINALPEDLAPVIPG